MSTQSKATWQVRSATRKDLPEILAIYNDAVLTTTATYDIEPRSLDHRVEWFEAHQRDGLPVLVAVTESGRVVGWGSLNRHHDRFGYRFTVENSIYVDAAHRGKGVGKCLLGPLIEAARKKAFHTILAGVDADNVASLRLHERFGYRPVAHYKEVGHKFGRWLDVIYLQVFL